MSTAQQVGGAERILQVAIGLFAQKGYEATSTREIVEAAGVTKPMLYYYFGSKEGLCKAAIKRFVQPFFAELRQTTAESREPRELLVDFVWMHFQHFHNHRDVFQFYMSLCFGPDREKFLQDFESLGEEIHVLFGELASRVARTGILRPGCEEDFAITLQHTIQAQNMARFFARTEPTRQLAQRTVDNLLDGFGAK
jgi:AcrR family transcriptional regulator